MKILFMADVPAGPDSGAAGTEYQTIAALRRLGCEVDDVWQDELPHKIRHGNLHYLCELPLAYRKLMLERLHRKHYDVIHVNQPHGYLAARALADKKAGSIFIHRSHGLEIRVREELLPWQNMYGQDARSLTRRAAGRILSRALARSDWRIARYADGHIVSARQCRDYLNQKMAVAKERIAVIPQAPPASLQSTPAPAMTRSRLRHVLYVGQFAFVKAPMITAQVMNRLAEIDEEVCFTWICSREHHSQVVALLTEAVRARLDLLDWMPQEELRSVYDQHGIFLFPRPEIEIEFNAIVQNTGHLIRVGVGIIR